MDLKEFAVSMAYAVQSRLSDQVEVLPQTVNKNNGVNWQGLTFRKQNYKSAPTIYLEPYYEAFQEGEDLVSLARQVVNCYNRYADYPQFEPDFFQDYEGIRGQVVYKLVNYQSNAGMLAEVPHLPYLDLAMVFYCLIAHSEIGMATILIRDSHLKMWNITHKTLYEDARVNTPRLLQPEFKSMGEVLQLPEEELRDAPVLHVLTNEMHMNGAASVLYEGMLEQCAGQFQESFFLLPSSIHEVILLPYARGIEVSKLRAIVREANQTQVEPQEKLSDSVYFYSREEKKLLIL